MENKYKFIIIKGTNIYWARLIDLSKNNTIARGHGKNENEASIDLSKDIFIEGELFPEEYGWLKELSVEIRKNGLEKTIEHYQNLQKQNGGKN